MNRERISEALNGISVEYITQCEAYLPEHPSEQEDSMGRYQKHTKLSGRKLLNLLLAACLVMGLGVTAYAAGAASWITNWVQSFYYVVPDEELRESRPDYAEWLDEQLETQAIMEEIGKNAQTVNEKKQVRDVPEASITLLESYYDGDKFAVACRFEKPQWEPTFDFDENHPLFAELQEEQQGYWSEHEAWEQSVPEEENRAEIRRRLEQDGRVGFTTYNFFLSDHVQVNGEDPGYFHTDPEDRDGIFYVDPYYTSVFGEELPDSCKNLPELEIGFTVRRFTKYYWLEGDSIQWAVGDIEDYPISFTIVNPNYGK